MGRKPYALRNNNDKVPMLEKPSVEPSIGNPLVENLNNKISSELMHLNTPANGVVTLHESTSLKQVKEKKELQQKKPASVTLKRYVSKVRGSSVRHSERIKKAVIPNEVESEHAEFASDKDVTASESEKDVNEVESEHIENLNGKNLEEKVAYSLQKIEALDKSLKLLKSKVDEDVGLYEALAEENLQLTGKLERSLGKIDVYEKENHVLIQVLDKMKEVVNAVVMSNLARTTEAAVNAVNATTRSASAAKRKRSTSES